MNILTKLLLIALIAAAGIAHAETAFTYQGRLGNAGQPADGLHDFRFRLFDDAAAGGQVGVDQSLSSVDVDAGIFTVQLDFGDGPFNAAPRWLEIAVRETGAGAYTTLTPRQRVGAAPFAIETLFVAPGAVDTAALQDDAVTRPKIADDAIGTFQIENNTVTSADIRDGTIITADIAPGIYRTKADLYEVTGPGISIGASPLNETVACSDPNDLPVSGGCRAGTASSLVATSVIDSNWTSTTDPASVTCSGVNLTPTNPGSNRVSLQAYIICVNVSGP
ncbi:MAG: hypothetical protein R3F22_09310 [Lysobacteraceae bacterium]